MPKLEIRRNQIASNDARLQNWRFSLDLYYYEEGTKFKITKDSIDFVEHEIKNSKGEWVKSERVVPVIWLRKPNPDDKEDRGEVIYIKSFLKTYYDHLGEKIEVTGTLNSFIQSLTGKNKEEFNNAIAEKIGDGATITAKLFRRTKYDVNGDVRETFINGWDIDK